MTGAPMFRLKTKKKSDSYNLHTCAASRCTERSAVLLALDDGPWPGMRVPLCERHWQAYCDASAGDGRC